MLALVWAQARDADGRPVIGAANALPWRVPEDAARFKALTLGHPVVMGRLTWDSLPARFRPLPGRTNVIVSRQPGWRPTPDDGTSVPADVSAGGATVRVVLTVEEALRLARAAPGGEETWVVGGAQLYAATVEHADRLEVTELDLEVEGDAWAPRFDATVWTARETGAWETSRSGVRYRFVSYWRAVPRGAGGVSG